VISIAVAIGAVVWLVRFVDDNSNNEPANENPAAAAQANKEAEIIVSQDQAPHIVALATGIKPRLALERAVSAEMTGMIAHGELDGPLQRTSCATAPSREKLRLAFNCTVIASNVHYPFVGVVDVKTRQITFCKRDPPPVPAENIPVSARCTAA
jgi:hypothetical protein